MSVCVRVCVRVYTTRDDSFEMCMGWIGDWWWGRLFRGHVEGGPVLRGSAARKRNSVGNLPCGHACKVSHTLVRSVRDQPTGLFFFVLRYVNPSILSPTRVAKMLNGETKHILRLCACGMGYSDSADGHVNVLRSLHSIWQHRLTSTQSVGRFVELFALARRAAIFAGVSRFRVWWRSLHRSNRNHLAGKFLLCAVLSTFDQLPPGIANPTGSGHTSWAINRTHQRSSFQVFWNCVVRSLI